MTEILRRAMPLSLGLALGVMATAHAGNAAFYREVNLLAGWSEADGWVGQGNSLKNSMGFEYFRKIAGEYGDVLTLDVQVRLSYDTSGGSDQRWAIELHNVWMDYKIGLGRTLRVGHFDQPFGLEPSLDTHGILFQTMAMQDIGFKKDWGIGFRSGLGPFDYEVAAGLGSGMGIALRDGSFLISARIGTPGSRQLRYGVSALVGDVLTGMPDRTIPGPEYGPAVRKTRIGVDAHYLVGALELKGEATVGRNEDCDVFGGLVQMDFAIPTLQSLTFTAQGWMWTDRPGDRNRRMSSAGLGVSYRVTPGTAIRAAVFAQPEGLEEEVRAYAQVYYYGR